MIGLLYGAILVATVWILLRYFRGRTVEGLLREPPPGADLNAVVGTLSYIEHELIKHRIPVVQSLVAKRTWNAQDLELLARTVGRAEGSLPAELDRYLEVIQREAGLTPVNLRRDRAFRDAVLRLARIQRLGAGWVRDEAAGDRARRVVDRDCAWFSGPFRHYLVELRRSVFRCLLTQPWLTASAQRGLSESGRSATLTVDVPPAGCVASVLPADLALVVRNLVRNAAQAGAENDLAVRVDVVEVVEETGEESILVRVHDRNPKMLVSKEIYGREAQRGLGLVTAALARHRGSLRCVGSTEPGFAKAMEVRLWRALHEPDARALQLGRPRAASWALPTIVAALHAALLAAFVVPWLSPHPLAGLTPTPPPSCVARSLSGGAELLCDPLAPGAAGVPISWPVSDPPHPNRIAADPCVAAAPERLDVAACLWIGQLEPVVELHYDSFWRRQSVLLRVSWVTSTEHVFDAARHLAGRGSRLIDRLFEHLLEPRRGLSAEQQAAASAWRIRAELVRARQSDVDACAALSRIERAFAAANADAPAERDEILLLRALAAVYLGRAGDARAPLRELARRPGPTRASARIYLAVLESESSSDAGEVHTLLGQLWDAYLRPAANGHAGGDQAVELRELPWEGTPPSASIPELLCAFRHRYPEVGLPRPVATALAEPCSRRPVSAELLAWLAELGARTRTPAQSCLP